MDRCAEAWAASGAMALTGWPDGPGLGAPAALVQLLDRASLELRRCSGGQLQVDGLALLGERAALAGLYRQGQVSCGGGSRLLRAANGWMAVSLVRPDDMASVPAWLEIDGAVPVPWAQIEELVGRRSVEMLDDRAALLGLPVAAVRSVSPRVETELGLPVSAELVGGRAGPLVLSEVTVIDLSALWAGPLCGQLLAQAGARVIKVESITRPDGARLGPAPFFDLLNADKKSVALDLRRQEDREALHGLLSKADVVIEGSRPRALEQMGLMAGAFLRQWPGPQVWLSITSHGRSSGDRVGFGDVAGAAGGLVAWEAERPCFIADAVMDPVTGLVAAAAVATALAQGGRWLLDAGMAPLAASVAGAPLDVTGLQAQPPQARVGIRTAPALGTDTEAVLTDLAA